MIPHQRGGEESPYDGTDASEAAVEIPPQRAPEGTPGQEPDSGPEPA